jgi:hypothetical protein
VLAEEALNAFVECTSGFVSGNRLSITLKLGLKRVSISGITTSSPASKKQNDLCSIARIGLGNRDSASPQQVL